MYVIICFGEKTPGAYQQIKLVFNLVMCSYGI